MWGSVDARTVTGALFVGIIMSFAWMGSSWPKMGHETSATTLDS